MYSLHLPSSFSIDHRHVIWCPSVRVDATLQISSLVVAISMFVVQVSTSHYQLENIPDPITDSIQIFASFTSKTKFEKYHRRRHVRAIVTGMLVKSRLRYPWHFFSWSHRRETSSITNVDRTAWSMPKARLVANHEMAKPIDSHNLRRLRLLMRSCTRHSVPYIYSTVLSLTVNLDHLQ